MRKIKKGDVFLTLICHYPVMFIAEEHFVHFSISEDFWWLSQHYVGDKKPSSFEFLFNIMDIKPTHKPRRKRR